MKYLKKILLSALLLCGAVGVKAADVSYIQATQGGSATFDAQTNAQGELQPVVILATSSYQPTVIIATSASRPVFAIGDPTTSTQTAPVSLVGLVTEQRSSSLASYAASTHTINIAASATDVCTLTGSATRTVKVNYVVVTGSQTTAGNVNVHLVKRSTANSGVVVATMTAVPFDSASNAATAVARAYAVNPTLGATVGVIDVNRVLLPTPTTTSLANYSTSFGFLTQPIVLRGVNDVLAINFNSNTIAGGVLVCEFVWTEE